MKILTLVIFSFMSLTGLMASNQMSTHLGFPIVSQTTDVSKKVVGYEFNDSEKSKVGIFKRLRKSFQAWKQFVKEKIKKERDKGHTVFGILTLINLGMSVLSFIFAYILSSDLFDPNVDLVGLLAILLYLLSYLFFIQTLVILAIWLLYFIIKLLSDETPKKTKKKKKKKKSDLLI